MDREILERILEQLSGIERRLAALEGEAKDDGHEGHRHEADAQHGHGGRVRHGHDGHGPVHEGHDGHGPHGHSRHEDERRGRDRGDGGQSFDEKRVVDLIVDLVEERLVRVLDRTHRRTGSGELPRGGGCRHCGQMPYGHVRR